MPTGIWALSLLHPAGRSQTLKTFDAYARGGSWLSTETCRWFPQTQPRLTLFFSQPARYSPLYGIIFKDKLTGKWKTWVNSSVWWWGADDWATGYSECRI